MFDRKEYYLDNKEKIKKQMKQWYINNCEYKKQYNKQWCKDNKEKKLKYDRQYRKNRRKTDIKFNLGSKIEYAIWKALTSNKNGRKWETLVGYTKNDLIKRLEQTMPTDYTWQDYMEGKLHIDHIIPKSVFNFTEPEHPDFIKCWSLKNLRLLPARENIIKKAKLSKPFQPALQIC